MEAVVCEVEIDDLDAFVARLGEIGDAHGCAIAAFSPRYVACERQLERAVALANRAFSRGENVADDRAIEILLYAAGRRQIDQALEIGVQEDEKRTVLAIDGEEEADALSALSALVTPTGEAVGAGADPERIATYFGITEAEREATDADLCDLVRERVALLDVEK
jgi:KEOPS complex subunit Cgi121